MHVSFPSIFQVILTVYGNMSFLIKIVTVNSSIYFNLVGRVMELCELNLVGKS